MKKALFFILTISLVFSLIACNETETPDTEETPPPIDEPSENGDGNGNNNNTGGTNYGITVNTLKFERLEFSDLPENIQSSIDKQREKEGYDLFINSDNGEMTLVVYAGQRPSAGYDIEVTQVQDNEGHTNVSVKEITPKEDQVVADVITYPYDIVKFSGATDDINIYYTNKNEEQGSILTPNNDTLTPREIQKEGIYVGQIDSNSVEIKIDGEANAFRLSEKAKDYLAQNKIESKSKVVIIYTMNDNEQQVIQKIIELE